MQDAKEEILAKINSAREAVTRLTKERDQLEVQIAPLSQKLVKIVADRDYWTRRIEKLTGRLAEFQEVKNG